MALAGLSVALFSLVAAPAEASPVDTTVSLRAARRILVTSIAALTDEAERAQMRAADADRRRALSQAALQVVRKRFARHAVDAYLDGIQDSETRQLRRKAWAGALDATDREVIGEFRTARVAAEKEQAAAEAAVAHAQRAKADVDAARLALERTIRDHATYERAAARSLRARTAAMATKPLRSAQHARATGSQAEIMRRYRFGPGDVPDGLVRTGDVIQGKASWYGPGFDGRSTASGAIFDQEGWTVAHRTLPLGTILLVSYGGRSVVVLVNDRGPYAGGRILDLSHGVANALGTVDAGVATVRAEILVPA